MYRYEEHREQLFTDEGQRMFLKIRDIANALLDRAGAFRLQEAIRNVTGDGWLMLACVDRMVELGEIREISDNTVAGYRIFVRGKR